MSAVAECLRLFRFARATFGRLVVLLIMAFAFPGLDMAPEDVSHNIDSLVAMSQHPATGTCHQSSHQCSVVAGAAIPWDIPTALARETWLRPSGSLAPDEFLKPFDTPPPRV